MLRIITQRKLNEIIRKAESDAFSKAFTFGYQMCRSDFSKTGFIFSPGVRKDLDEILREKGVE